MGEVVIVEEETGPTSSGSISQREIEGVKTATFYQWKYSHYFVVVEEGVKNMRARCTLCAPSSKPLSSARNTTSNLKKHLETVHKTITDNGSNFVKAFATFGIPDSGAAESSISSLLTSMEDDEENEEEVTFENLDDLITLVRGN